MYLPNVKLICPCKNYISKKPKLIKYYIICEQILSSSWVSLQSRNYSERIFVKLYYFLQYSLNFNLTKQKSHVLQGERPSSGMCASRPLHVQTGLLCIQLEVHHVTE